MAAPALIPKAEACPPLYRPRNPRTTPLFQLVEQHYDDVKALWEDRLENAHGRWRGFTDTVVARLPRLRLASVWLRPASL